jgi:acyl-CoA thioester hydrolase
VAERPGTDDSELPLAGRLTALGHELSQRVYFEDTDFTGRVYHARYLQFMERGRSDYLRLIGIHHRALAAEGRAFAVRHMAIDFLKPASIDDVLTIRTATVEAKGARVLLRQEVLRGEELLVTAVVTVALVGEGGRPAKLPSAIRNALAPGPNPNT